MAKRKPRKKQPVKLTVDDPATRKQLATWLDEGIKAAENAIATLKEGLPPESATFVKPNIQYWKHVIGGIKWLQSRMSPK